MCGIVGYIGRKNAAPLLIEGLKRLEYRGYDSAGLCLQQDGGLFIRKSPGRIAALESILANDCPQSGAGIAHTRWATHGEPNQVNAHPQTDADGAVAVVHNGIIENYAELRQMLFARGVKFASQTDTETLAHLISHFHRKGQTPLADAVRSALAEIVGTYGIAVMSAYQPGVIVAARKGSPLIVGVGSDEYVIASDTSAIVEHTSNVIYLNDDELVEVSSDSIHTTTLTNAPLTKEVIQIEITLDQIAKGDYEHFMLKEINEQPMVIRQTMAGRLDLHNMCIKLGGLEAVAEQLSQLRRLVLTGCGTAWHAATVGKYIFEELAGIPTEVDYASEFRYRNPIIEPNTAVIAISQSGETADTLAAIKESQQKGALPLGIVNVVGSTIARQTSAGVYTHAGPEIGVASTKAFTCQLVVEFMIALMLGRRRTLTQERMEAYIHQLAMLPEMVATVVRQCDDIKRIAVSNSNVDNWLFLGRGCNFPIAMEGALKLKEISYIHAEGMAAAEMKHGPIALIHPGMPVVFIATKCPTYDKICSNMEEVRARKGRIIALATEGDDNIERLADEIIYLPATDPLLQPIVNVVPLQLIAYHAAVARGCNVDKPRNLAKSVTVE